MNGDYPARGLGANPTPRSAFSFGDRLHTRPMASVRKDLALRSFHSRRGLLHTRPMASVRKVRALRSFHSRRGPLHTRPMASVRKDRALRRMMVEISTCTHRGYESPNGDTGSNPIPTRYARGSPHSAFGFSDSSLSPYLTLGGSYHCI
jgi:hypothetical protein